MILFLVLLFFLLFSIRNPDFMFWLGLLILMDPGGYIQVYIGRSALGGIQLWDLQFVLLFIPLISPKINVSLYLQNYYIKWILYFFIFFMIVYQLLIYGLILPGDINALFLFIGYERLGIYGFFSIIPAYIFFKRSYLLFFKLAFYSSIVLVVLYIATLVTKYPFVPLWIFSRGLDINALRISMYSYGFAHLFISVSLVFLFFKNTNYINKYIYFIGITMFIAIILTLTRRSIVGVFFTTFVIYYLYQKLNNKKILSTNILNLLIAGSFALTILFMTKPTYLKSALKMIESSISVVKTGKGIEGEKDIRLESDIPKHFEMFYKSPFFGKGYSSLWYSNDTEAGGLSANDVPLTAALGMYGIIGLFIFSIYYFKLIQIVRSTFRLLKISFHSGIYRSYFYLFTFMIVLIGIFISKFTISFMSLFSDLILDVKRVQSMTYVGFLIAGNEMLKKITIKNNIKYK